MIAISSNNNFLRSPKSGALTATTFKIVAKHVVGILETESIEFELEDLASIIHNSYPDFRKIINTCQKYVVENKLTLPGALGKNNDFQTQMVNELKKPSKTTFNTIRQLIADNNISSFDDLYKHLYDNTSEYAVGAEGQIAYLQQFLNTFHRF